MLLYIVEKELWKAERVCESSLILAEYACFCERCVLFTPSSMMLLTSKVEAFSCVPYVGMSGRLSEMIEVEVAAGGGDLSTDGSEVGSCCSD